MADDDTGTEGTQPGEAEPKPAGHKRRGADKPHDESHHDETEAATTPLDQGEAPTAALDTTAGTTAEMPASGGGDAPPAAAQAGSAGDRDDAPASAVPRRPGRWRRPLVVALIVIATLLAPLTLAVSWMDRDLLNTQNYVKAVAPLSSNPAIQTAAAHAVTNGLWNKVNVQQQLNGVLPSWAQIFAAPLSNTLKGYAYKATLAFVSSPAFSRIWATANEKGHATVKAALLGNQGGVVTTTNGDISLDLAPLADRIKATLDERGIHALDGVAVTPDATTFVIFHSDNLAKAQGWVRFFQKLHVALPLLLIAAWAGAIAVSWRRRRTVAQLALALAAAMAVTLVGYHLGRGAYLDAVSSPQLPRDAAAAIFDALASGLRAAARTVFVVGLIVGIGAMILGQARWAVRLREALSEGFGSLGSRAEAKGLDLGPVGGWVAAHHRALQITGLVVAGVVLVFWGTPGVAGVVWTLVVLLVYLAVVEFVGRLTGPAASAPR
ncbi:MAG TPA: hypothetical protein VL117_04770 [Thermoleophilia bacterium]|nr:hypothetical protein [Thermoleophilia bacterium]